MKISSFNWDLYNETKCQKHGLTVQEIEEFFFLEPVFAEDPRHSEDEDRYLAFGPFRGKYVLCAFTFRVLKGELKIRVISARYARKKEIEAMNEKTKAAKKID